MKGLNFKRLLAFVLVMMMLVTSLPLSALAVDTGEDSMLEGDLIDAVESKPFAKTTLLKQAKKDIAKILNKYLGTITMSEEDVRIVVSNMDEDTQIEALCEIEELSEKLLDLTDAELSHWRSRVQVSLGPPLAPVVQLDRILDYGSRG